MPIEAKKKPSQDILFMRYKQLQNISTIAETLNLNEDDVRKFLEQDTEARIKVFKDTPRTSDKYNLRKLDIINFLRNEQQRSCEEIAQMLNLTQNTVFAAFNEPKKSKRATVKHKVNLTRDEKRKRNEEILRLNAEEGLTLEAIGKQFNLTKQRISDILRDMGHVPLTGNKIKAMDKHKNKSVIHKKSIDTYNQKLEELSTALRVANQKSSMFKYYTAKQLIAVRCELMECIILNWEHNKPIKQFKSLVKILRTNFNHFSKSEKYMSTIEYQILRDVLAKCEELEKQYKL